MTLNLNDPSGQGDCVDLHQPKRSVPETAEDQTLQGSEAVHGVKWPGQAGEKPGGLLDQPEPVHTLYLMKRSCFLLSLFF